MMHFDILFKSKFSNNVMGFFLVWLNRLQGRTHGLSHTVIPYSIISAIDNLFSWSNNFKCLYQQFIVLGYVRVSISHDLRFYDDGQIDFRNLKTI